MSRSRVDVGIPPDNFNGWATVDVCFHGFANTPVTGENKLGICLESPECSCFGHQLTLRLYPDGSDHMNPEEDMASIELVNKSESSIDMWFGYNVRDAKGKEVEGCSDRLELFKANSGNAWGRRDAHGDSNFAERSTLMGSLINGTLVIEVRMKLEQCETISTPQHVPANPIMKNVLKLFNDEESADVVFEVGLQQAGIRSKTLRVNFHAHRCILKNSASSLYEMCGASDGGGGITTVSITDVSPVIFKHMLYYSYGGKLSEQDLMANAKDIIHACDKYGLVHLKLEAEATYAKLTEFTVENMMDNLLYADSKNLALLKEKVMDYIVGNKYSIMGNVSFGNFPGHLLHDLLAAVARGETVKSGEGDDVKYNRIRVGTLRKMLDEKGLSVDGSREEMVARLFKKEETEEGESVDRGERVLRRDGQWYDAESS